MEFTCNFTYLLEYRILQVRFSTVLVNICGDFVVVVFVVVVEYQFTQIYAEFVQNFIFKVLG